MMNDAARLTLGLDARPGRPQRSTTSASTRTSSTLLTASGERPRRRTRSRWSAPGRRLQPAGRVQPRRGHRHASPRCATAPSWCRCRASCSSNLSITDTLRAQTHEFGNQLHTISGLVQLEEYDEVRSLVGTLTRRRAEIVDFVTERLHDPAGRRAAWWRSPAWPTSAAYASTLTDGLAPAAARPERLRRPHHACSATWSTTRSTRAAAASDPRGDRRGAGRATRRARRGARQRSRRPRGAAGRDLRAGLLHQARRARWPRDRPPAGAADLHPARRRSVEVAPRASGDRLPGRGCPYSSLQRVAVITRPRRRRRLHGRATSTQRFVERTDGFEVVGSAHTGADALDLAAELDARPGAARRAPAGHERARRAGARSAPGQRRGRGDGDRRARRRRRPHGAARRRDAVPREAVRVRRPRRPAPPGGRGAGRAAPPGRPTRSRSTALFGGTPGRRPTTPATLPKGLSPETADLVLAALRESGEQSRRPRRGDQVGLSRVTARRYLEHFVDTGVAEVRLQYGAAGRPERRYRVGGRTT